VILDAERPKPRLQLWPQVGEPCRCADDVESYQFVPIGYLSLVAEQQLEQGAAVFSARDCYCYPVCLADEVELADGTSDLFEEVVG
jgi:hypothetical protein